ncbi:hypothetical protein T10_2851 [Trichinella papuae]|uniref:Uncharacterized protein n=1 Tax=Trichinella papuae TaxID=268474 RepID=A0A0V1MBE3_9BILA|nr:hypothetical protein T10_2851 [Trichinella papuae]
MSLLGMTMMMQYIKPVIKLRKDTIPNYKRCIKRQVAILTVKLLCLSCASGSSSSSSSSSSSDKSNCPKKTSNMKAELLQCICRPLVASEACRACLFRANKSRCWSRMGNNIICCILESHFSKMNFCYLSNSEENFRKHNDKQAGRSDEIWRCVDELKACFLSRIAINAQAQNQHGRFLGIPTKMTSCR